MECGSLCHRRPAAGEQCSTGALHYMGSNPSVAIKRTAPAGAVLGGVRGI